MLRWHACMQFLTAVQQFMCLVIVARLARAPTICRTIGQVRDRFAVLWVGGPKTEASREPVDLTAR
jgi:hypothetical protein